MRQEARSNWLRKEVWIGIAGIAVTIGLVAAAIYYKDDLMRLANVADYSLLGLFIISFIASSTFSITAVPLPFWLLVLALPGILASEWGILAPLWIGLVTALGITLGQFLTFMIGYGGKGLSAKITAKFQNRFYTRAMDWAKRHGSLAVFVMSVAFNPLHLPMTLAMGSLHYPPHKFFLYSFLGNVVKSLIVAFGGYFGLTALFPFLET